MNKVTEYSVGRTVLIFSDNETLPPISEADLPDEDYFMDYTQTQDATTCNGHGTTVDANGTCTCFVDAQGTASKCSSNFFANGFLGHGGSYCQLGAYLVLKALQ